MTPDGPVIAEKGDYVAIAVAPRWGDAIRALGDLDVEGKGRSDGT